LTGYRTLEARLVLLLCGTEDQRQLRMQEAESLSRGVDGVALLALLERVNLVNLVGRRLLALDAPVPAGLAEKIELSTCAARERGTLFELITLSVLAALDKAGLRALPLKGSILARQVHGDTGLRSSVDIDILVAREELSHAVSVVAEMGWELEVESPRIKGLPLLHETLIHPTLPSVELHWRVHWYEDRFASEALQRAEAWPGGERLRMQPADELAAMILFYARDGFSGLRIPADIAAWWSAEHQRLPDRLAVRETARQYSELSAPLLVGAALLERLVGVPAPDLRVAPIRWRVARSLADPFLASSPPQVRANASLIDLLLAPPRGYPESLGRELNRAPRQRRVGKSERPVSKLEHFVRVLRRWGLALSLALMRFVRGGRTDQSLDATRRYRIG